MSRRRRIRSMWYYDLASLTIPYVAFIHHWNVFILQIIKETSKSWIIKLIILGCYNSRLCDIDFMSGISGWRNVVDMYVETSNNGKFPLMNYLSHLFYYFKTYLLIFSFCLYIHDCRLQNICFILHRSTPSRRKLWVQRNNWTLNNHNYSDYFQRLFLILY